MLKFGASALWLPVGFTAGYLTLLLFVAAPLRRFGSYTIPDFAEARLPGRYMRLLAAAIVLLISGCYLVPQLKGAGVTLRAVTDAPYWVGVAIVAAIVALNVALGGMRGVTYVQAFQYWVKVFAIAFPAILLLIHLGGLPARAALFGDELPSTGPDGMVVELDRPRTLTFPDTGETRIVPAGELRLPPDTAVPVAAGIDAQTGDEWSRPVSESGRGSPLLIYSLLLATFLGTMGLPHILVRFYTNPDGSAARRTTVRVLGLLGVFYLFPAVYGLLGRAFTRRALRHGRHRLGRAARARRRVAGADGRHPGRDRRRGRLRGLHEHGARACWSRSPARSRTTSGRGRADGGGHGSGSPPRAGWSRPRCWRSSPARSTSRCSSAGPSRSPPARSARCCCSASGGRG